MRKNSIPVGLLATVSLMGVATTAHAQVFTQSVLYNNLAASPTYDSGTHNHTNLVFGEANSGIDYTSASPFLTSHFDAGTNTTTTALMADDFILSGPNSTLYNFNLRLTDLKFQLVNLGTNPLTVNVKIRIWDDNLKISPDPFNLPNDFDAPGTLLKTGTGGNAIYSQSVTLNDKGLNEFSSSLVDFDLKSIDGGAVLHSTATKGNRFYLGFTFETAGNNVADLDKIGVLVNGAGPSLGSSADFLLGGAAGTPSSYTGNNPFPAGVYGTGSDPRFDFGSYAGNPIANLAFQATGQVILPEPGTFAFLATGFVPIGMILRRRRRV